MAKLAAVVDSLDTVEPALHPFYQPGADGKYVLQAEVTSHPETGALKSALDRQKRENADLKQKLKAATPPPDDEAEDPPPNPLEREVARLNAELKKDREQKAQIAKRARDKAADAAVAEAITKHKGNPLLLTALVRSKVAGFDDDGDFVARVVDAKGNPVTNEDGTPKTVEALVAELKGNRDYAGAFEGTGGTGSGAQPSRPGSGTQPVRSTADLRSTADKAAYIKEHGFEGYQRLVDASLKPV